MNSINRILIADDHELIRKGLIQTLSLIVDAEIIEANSGKAALQKVEEYKPELVILDIEMPELSGYEAAKFLKENGFSGEIIFLTMYKDESLFNKALDLGVKGFVLKENTVTEIEQCLQAVIKGNYYISPEISDFLVKRNLRQTSQKSEPNDLSKLTPTELTIVHFLAKMKTSQDIADELGVSLKTIKNHRNNICSKLGLSGAHALLKYAIEHVKN